MNNLDDPSGPLVNLFPISRSDVPGHLRKRNRPTQIHTPSTERMKYTRLWGRRYMDPKPSVVHH